MDIQLFHFLRPGWLLAILPLAVFLYLSWHRQQRSQGWGSVIDPSLLPHLLDAQVSQHRRNNIHVAGAALLVALLSLAGPTWHKLPQPVQQTQDGLVILYDMSQSMVVEDVKPSRLVRSRQKLIDLLDRRSEGTVALVAYAGDEHVVSPLTDDDRTIANLLPALSPSMMPLPGNQPVRAVGRARKLLEDGNMQRGHIILVTDGVPSGDVSDMLGVLQGSEYRLSVLGVGGEGGPIPTGQSYLRNSRGEIVFARFDRAPLQRLAAKGGGVYTDLTLDNRDLNALLGTGTGAEQDYMESGTRRVDIWQDMGFWLLPLLVPPLLIAFRRGWVLMVLVAVSLAPGKAMAYEWRDLWATPDQQGARLLEEDKAAEAAERFSNPRWKAAANYRAGEFEEAAELYGQSDNADAWYNRGNSLARAGDLESALHAYDQALEHNPDMEDALFNKNLVEQLKEQQQQQQGMDDQQSEGDQQQSEGENQQGQNQQGQGEQQQSEQQSGQQQSEQQSGQQSDQQEEQQASSGSQAEDSEQDENNTAMQQQAQPSEGEDTDNEDEQQTGMSKSQPTQSREKRERVLAQEQWLRRIPDDPSGLLRRKFEYESQQRVDRRRDNDDEERY